MMSMNVWKRATLAIVRKPVRSGIIGLLMLMVFTSLVAQVGVSTALRTMSDSIGAGMGIGFTVSAGENPISAEEASRFSRIPGVTKTAYATKTLAQVDGARRSCPGRAPGWTPICHAGQRAGHHRFLIVRGIPERPVPPGAGPPYLGRRRRCAGPPRLRAAERPIDRLDIPSPAGGAQRHGACGRDLLRQRAGPKPPALGHFREPHLFGQASDLRSDRKRPDRHDPMPVG